MALCAIYGKYTPYNFFYNRWKIFLIFVYITPKMFIKWKLQASLGIDASWFNILNFIVVTDEHIDLTSYD